MNIERKERRMKYKILDVHPEDAYHVAQKYLIERIVTGNDLKVWPQGSKVGPPGWWYGKFELKGDPVPHITRYGHFFAAKLEKIE